MLDLAARPVLTLALLAAVAPVLAQEPAPPRAARADLALAYTDFEAALAAAGALAPDRRATVEREFDRLTVAFFSGQTEAALVALRALTARLQRGEAAPAPAPAAYLLARVEPPVALRGAPGPRVRLTLLRGAPGLEGLRYRLSGAGGERAIAPRPDDPRTLELPADLRPGRYELEALGPGEARATLARCSVVADAPAALRARLAARLAALDPSPGRKVARARLALLAERPDPNDTAQALADLDAVARELAAEVDALAAGRDPYTRRVGNLWRPYRSGGRAIPLRVYAPREAADGPLPLLVAFHGAGGDENMFAWGYGGGALLREAAQRGLLVACPRTEAFFADPAAAYRDLLDELSRDYAFDRERVCLLGHSLGTVAIDRLLLTEPQGIAGVVCFSGRPRRTPARTLVFQGALDPFQALAGRAPTDQPNLALRRLPGYGHTLLVGERLPEALDWLLGARPWRRWF
ncbi:MAG: hypothetical protein AB7N76_00220 [Planctomycetota bacterium]